MQAVMTAFEVLEHVAQHQPVGVSELARGMSIPKSTAQRMLKTLQAAGWIRARSSDDPRWILTPRVLSLGARVGDAEALRVVAAEPMRVLGQATGETVHLVVPDGLEVVVLAKVPSIHAVQPLSFVGNRSPIHATSGGKAMLAMMSDRERAALLSDQLRQLTPNTLTTRRDLDEEFARIRERGWASNREEYQIGISSVGAAILAHDRPVGAITVSIPSMRLDEHRVGELGPLVAKSARTIAANLDATA